VTTVSGDVTTVSGDVTTVSGDVTTASGEVTTDPNVTTTDSGVPGSGTETTPDPATTTTTEPLPENVRVVTSYTISFTPPTRVNYWSHDTRTFKESGGLKDLAASLKLLKFYVNDNDEICNASGIALTDANGNVFKYNANDASTLDARNAFFEKEFNITGETHPLYTEDSPIEVWQNEIKAQFGSSYTAEQELQASHKNKYPMRAYFHPTESSEDDLKMLGNEPIYLGDFNIFIGVKGDFNLDNVVSADDAQSTLRFYTNYYVSMKYDTKLSDNPDFDGLDGLVFYLINVRYRDGNTPNDPLDDPQTVGADDAQCILRYYTNKYVSLIDDYTWEDAVGYDLLDKFYGDSYED